MKTLKLTAVIKQIPLIVIMKKLSLVIIILFFISCKTSNIINIVNTQAKEHVYGKIVKIVERRYLNDTNLQSYTNERHIFFESKQQIKKIIEFRVFQNLETGKTELEKMGEMQYNYKGNKLFKVIEINNTASSQLTTASDDEQESNKNENITNYIQYTFLDDNTSRYQAFRNHKIDHEGIIIITKDFEATETINYPNEGMKPVVYYKNYNDKIQLTNYIREYYYDNELKTEKTSYTYSKNNVSIVSTKNYKIHYEYKFDKKGNWINRIGKVNGDIVEILKREITYN